MWAIINRDFHRSVNVNCVFLLCKELQFTIHIEQLGKFSNHQNIYFKLLKMLNPQQTLCGGPLGEYRQNNR